MNRNCPYKMVVTSWITYFLTSQHSLWSCIVLTISETHNSAFDRSIYHLYDCIMFAKWENSVPLFFHDLVPLIDTFIHSMSFSQRYAWPSPHPLFSCLPWPPYAKHHHKDNSFSSVPQQIFSSLLKPFFFRKYTFPLIFWTHLDTSIRICVNLCPKLCPSVYKGVSVCVWLYPNVSTCIVSACILVYTLLKTGGNSVLTSLLFAVTISYLNSVVTSPLASMFAA